MYFFYEQWQRILQQIGKFHFIPVSLLIRYNYPYDTLTSKFALTASFATGTYVLELDLFVACNLFTMSDACFFM